MSNLSGLSGPVPATPPDQISDSAAEVWVGLYQAERADLTALYLATLAVLGFAATVLVASIAVSTTPGLNPLALASLPIPLSAIILYNAVLASLTRRRANAARLLETAILKRVGSPADQRSLLILAGEAGINPQTSYLLNRIAIQASNAIIPLVGLVFVSYCSWSASGRLNIFLLVSLAAISVAMVAVAVILHIKQS